MKRKIVKVLLSRRRKVLLLLTLCSILLAVAVFYQKPPHVQKNSFPVTHYRQADVDPGITQYPPHEGDEKAEVKGGIVSHHLLAGSYIAKYFQTIGSSRYTRVVLIGPNHGELGEYRAVTSLKDWDTPYGRVLADKDGIGTLLADGHVHVGDDVLAADHADEVIMPYIKVYMPTAQVIPLLLSGHTTMQELESIGAAVANLLGDNTVVIVSSDFSHYLLPSVAAGKDKETLALLRTGQKDKILDLGNDYVDSPPSIVLLMGLMEKIGARKMDVLDHADGSTIAGTPHAPTTTYFFITYSE